jgi:hypothetical protein
MKKKFTVLRWLRENKSKKEQEEAGIDKKRQKNW